MRHFSPKQLQDYLDQTSPPPLLLDVREQWEFDYCHIQDSVLIPMGELPNELESLNTTQGIVVICHHGIRSRHMGLYMEQAGFKDIINLEGGVEQWAEDIEPSMRRY
ncbi:MAG: rhodanese-like domain-containing protein [Woeseiaceae bacterium]